MDTDRLRVFIAVGQTESIRQAAQLLHLSPSAISKSVKLLEEELGVPLVVAQGRGIALTHEGKKLSHEGQRILSDLDLLKSNLSTDHDYRKSLPLRIASFEVFSTHFLGNLAKVHWGERGLVHHELIPGEIERAVAEEQVDIGITIHLPMAHPKVEHLKIGKMEMGVFRKKGAFNKLPQNEVPFVVPARPLGHNTNILRELDGWPDDAYRRKVRFEVTLMESALELARQGLCAGYFPVFVVNEHNQKHKSDYQLERHPSLYPDRKCFSDIYLVKRKDRTEDDGIKKIASMIRMSCR